MEIKPASTHKVRHADGTKTLQIVGVTNITGNTAVTGTLSSSGATTFPTSVTSPSVVIDPATGTANNLNLSVKVTDHTTDGGATTETITGAIPTGAVVLSVTAIVTTILAGTGLTGETWSLGDGTDADLYGTGLALAAGTTVDSTDWTASPFTHAYASGDSADLVMTSSVDGVFDTGVIRVTVVY